MNVFFICICSFLAVVLGINSLYLMSTRNKRNMHRRLEKISASSFKTKIFNEDHHEKGDIKKSFFQKTGKLLFRKGMTKQIEEQLTKADIPLRGEEFLLIWMLVGLLPVSLVYITVHNIGLVFLVYLIGILLIPLMVRIAQQKKLKKFNQQISDTLSIMANALRAGFSFIQSMDMVGREMPVPISKEFARTYREISLGAITEEALQKMVKRVSSDDLDLLVTAVLIQRQVGGNLAEVLDNISHTIRERIRIKGEIKTLTAQGRISGLVIGIIPPCLIVVLLLINPGYMQPLLYTPIGWTLLAVGAFAEIIGILIIKKIITIDY